MNGFSFGKSFNVTETKEKALHYRATGRGGKKERNTKGQEETGDQGREIKRNNKEREKTRERDMLYRCLFLIKISCTTSWNLPSAPATSTETHTSMISLNRNDRLNNVYSPRVNLSLFAGETEKRGGRRGVGGGGDGGSERTSAILHFILRDGNREIFSESLSRKIACGLESLLRYHFAT